MHSKINVRNALVICVVIIHRHLLVRSSVRFNSILFIYAIIKPKDELCIKCAYIAIIV